MPKPIPIGQIIDVVVSYTVKRLIQGRPTTLRQVSKRVGLGVPTVKVELERNYVQYILIPYGEKDWVTSSIEIAIQTMPDSLAERNGFKREEIEAAYQKYFGKYDLDYPDRIKQLDIFKGIEGEAEDMMIAVDPYSPYRIDGEQFRVLKRHLISFPRLIQEAKKRGYSGRAVERATGGSRMRYELPSDIWRPYVYRNKRFFLKEVLNYLHQSFRTYKNETTAELKKESREAIALLEEKERDDKTKRRATA